MRRPWWRIGGMICAAFGLRTPQHAAMASFYAQAAVRDMTCAASRLRTRNALQQHRTKPASHIRRPNLFVTRCRFRIQIRRHEPFLRSSLSSVARRRRSFCVLPHWPIVALSSGGLPDQATRRKNYAFVETSMAAVRDTVVLSWFACPRP